MTEFLFSILITRIYGHDEDMLYLPKEIEIKIEIPNGFVDLFKKFPLLSIFDKQILLLRDLPLLIVPKDIKSNIQIVANYLKFRENIDNIDLDIKEITPHAFIVNNTLQKAEMLSPEECQSLIFTELKKTIDFPNYYQIKSFIDVLANQLICFTRNYFLSSSLLREHRVQRSIRTFIIESFIKLTKHFTKGAYDELVAQQKETEISLNQEHYDSNKDLNNGIKALSKVNANLISFDKFNYSLIFFHEGDGQGFSIISNLPSIKNSTNNSGIRDEYNKLKKLLNYQTYKGQNNRNFQELPLPDYKSYNQIQFLEELKIIFNLRNPVTNEELNKKIEFQKEIVQFIKKYNNYNDEQREEKILKTEKDIEAALEKCRKDIESTSDSIEKKNKKL